MKQILLAVALMASSAVMAEVRGHRPGSDIIIIRPGSDVSLRNQAIRAAQQARHELEQLANEVYDYGGGGGGFGIIDRGGSGRRHSNDRGEISALAEGLAESLQFEVIDALRKGERIGQVARSVDYLMGDLGDLAEAIRYSSQSEELSFRFGRVIQFFRQLQNLL